MNKIGRPRKKRFVNLGTIAFNVDHIVTIINMEGMKDEPYASERKAGRKTAIQLMNKQTWYVSTSYGSVIETVKAACGD